MNRDTRDKFVASTDQSKLAYGESACLETPPELFATLHAEFHFNIDLTANEQNHLLPVWYGPGSISASNTLDAAWSREARCGFSNPPYGRFIELILAKAVVQQNFTSVFLLPLRAARWYRDFVLPHADEVRHIPRVTFNYQGKPAKHDKHGRPATALFDSIVVVYRPHPMMRHGEAYETDSSGQLSGRCCPHVSFWSWKHAS